MVNDDDSLALYRQFLAGDEEALHQLIALHRHSLTLFIHVIIDDMDEAENLMVDAFARLVISGEQFKGRSTLKTYLFAIGRNLAIRHKRKWDRGRLAPSHADNAPDDPEEKLLQMEQSREIYDALQDLPMQYRQVLYLLYYEDMSYAETAQVMHRSVKQVANLVQRAKASLRKTLETRGFTYG